jgi:hypothetical protein
MLTPEKANGAITGAGAASSDVLIHFSPEATREELRQVKELLATSPGPRRVQLVFGRPNGDALRVDAGADFCVDLTRDLEMKLSRWLIQSKAERRNIVAEVAVDVEASGAAPSSVSSRSSEDAEGPRIPAEDHANLI